MSFIIEFRADDSLREMSEQQEFEYYLGPFNEYIQVTYGELRVGPSPSCNADDYAEGATIARMTSEFVWQIEGVPEFFWSDFIITEATSASLRALERWQRSRKER